MTTIASGETSTAPVAIIGAGIAGLTLALALARRGQAVTILERAGFLSEVGAGLQLSPNASRILVDLGVGTSLADMSVEPRHIAVHDANGGGEIVRLPLGDQIRNRHGSPYFLTHRGDLQAILIEATRREALVTLHLGTVVEAVRDNGNVAEVDAFIGDQLTTLKAAAVIGADGVWSKTRSQFMGGESADYSGRTAYRATIPAEKIPAGLDLTHATGLWLGKGAHLVHYPLRHGREINFVIVVDDDWIDQRWDVMADVSDVIHHLNGWPEHIRQLMSLPDGWRKWALCAAPPGPFSRSLIALIGDAQHAMLPFAAQGGAMAIEDAAVLARCIANSAAPMASRLAAYGHARKSRVAAVVALARRNGTIYHLSGLAASARNAAMRLMGGERLINGLDWLYGWRDG